MDDCVRKEVGLSKHGGRTSDKGQSLQIRKLTPQVVKLRRDSFPVTPLSLNGSLTTVDVCDTSFGRKVIEDIKTNDARIPDESFSEEILLSESKSQQKLAKKRAATSSDASFDEEVLQDMDYSLDALRDAVPVFGLKKDEEEEETSCNDSDIFEEMSAFQVMGIFNNKNPKRNAKAFNRKREDIHEVKNKRHFPDKNIDVLYKNKDVHKSNEKLECIKLPVKKMDECDDQMNASMQDNEKDINNNDSNCTMEPTESSEDEYDWVQEIMLTENDDNQYNNCQGKEIPEVNGKMREPDKDDKSSSTGQNCMKTKVKENIEHAGEVLSKKLKVKVRDISNMCKNEVYKEAVNLAEIDVYKKGCLSRSKPEKRPIQKYAISLNENGDDCNQDFREILQSEPSDSSEIINKQDTMRQIVADFIKQLPSSSENFLIRVEPISECPMCYFQFHYKDFIFSTKTGAYIIDCTCGLTIYVIFRESLQLLKDYHSSNHSSNSCSIDVDYSSDACSSLTNATSLESDLEVSSPMIPENKNKCLNELNDSMLNKRKNRMRFIIFNDSDDEPFECEDDSDENYVP